MPESKSRRLVVCAALIVALFALAALGSSGASAAPRHAKAKAASSSSPRRVGAADVAGARLASSEKSCE
jgi:ABC-type phosphate transport system substrate-binding protein